MTSGLKTIDEEGEISRLLEKATEGRLEAEDLGEMLLWTSRWLQLKALLELKEVTLAQIRTVLLGRAPAKRSLQGDPEREHARKPRQPDPQADDRETKGHGKNPAETYTGCRKENIEPEGLKPGDPCPDCVGSPKGRLQRYKPSRPLTRLRLSGSAPITGTVYRGIPLCCSKCSAFFEPSWPRDARRETYDASSRRHLR